MDKNDDKLIPKGFFDKERQLWRLNTNPRIRMRIDTPQELFNSAQDYFAWADSNPLYGSEYKDGMYQQIPLKRPYTLHGLCLFIGVPIHYWKRLKETNTDPEIQNVIDIVETAVYQQKFEGAMVGLFNANLTARDLGLTDKQQIETTVNLKDAQINFE